MPAVAIRGQAAAAPVEGIAKVLLGFVERLDDLALELAQPAAHTIIPSPSRVFRGAD
jgi:hypothetical protein